MTFPKEVPGQTVKVLSLHQPYASLIAMGIKTIETRSWRAPQSLIGERIAIHAAAKHPARAMALGPRTGIDDEPAYGVVRDDDGTWKLWSTPGWVVLPFGAIVATARLVECLPMVESITIGEHARVERVLQIGPSADRLPIIDRWVGGGEVERYVTDQLPYGDFQIGRWAWMLADIRLLVESVPFRGGQGLSRSWTPIEVAA